MIHAPVSWIRRRWIGTTIYFIRNYRLSSYIRKIFAENIQQDPNIVDSFFDFRNFMQRLSFGQLRKWCGRPDSNRHRPFGPTDFHTRHGFRRPILRGSAPEGFGVWTIPSPWPCGFRCCPSSLYTFPFPGLARDCHLTGSPEFGQFCIFGFPESTQVWLKSVASTNFATPARRIAIALPLASANRDRRNCGFSYFREVSGASRSPRASETGRSTALSGRRPPSFAH
jgi:hypothetical protein